MSVLLKQWSEWGKGGVSALAIYLLLKVTHYHLFVYHLVMVLLPNEAFIAVLCYCHGYFVNLKMQNSHEL